MKLMEENTKPKKYKKWIPADEEVLTKLMSGKITLGDTLTLEKKIWEDKKSILSSMLAENLEEVMEIVQGAASLALIGLAPTAVTPATVALES